MKKLLQSAIVLCIALNCGLSLADANAGNKATNRITAGMPVAGKEFKNWGVAEWVKSTMSVLHVLKTQACPTPVLTAGGPVSFCQGDSVKLSTNGLFGVVSLVAGDGLSMMYNGSISYASFNNPTAIVTDAAGNIYVADRANNAIRKITATEVSTLAGATASGYTNGVGSAARFNNPAGITTGPDGNLYVTDYGNNCIRKVTPDGSVTTFAGDGSAGYADGAGTAAKFNHPVALAFDAAGTLFVSDEKNNRIRKILPNGTVSTVAGSIAGFADGTSAVAMFNSPAGLAFDADGNLYVADVQNNRVRQITTDGTVSTFAGTGTGGNLNGSRFAATLNRPFGLVVAPNGTVYFTDTWNQQVRKVTRAGKVSVVAGSGNWGYTNGYGDLSSFNYPAGLAINSNGELLVADQNNNRIRKVVPAEADEIIWSDGANANTGTVTVKVSGTYSVRTVSGTCTSDAAEAITVSVTNRPAIPLITASGPVVRVCEPVTLTATAAERYLWNNGETTQSITPSVSGNYSLMAIAGSCTSLSSVPVEVSYKFPALSVSASGPLTFCEGGSVSLSAPDEVYDVKWFAGKGNGSRAINGALSEATFTAPFGVCYDMSGNIFVAENDKVRKISPQGIVSTIEQAFYNLPHNIRYNNTDGNLYVVTGYGVNKLTVSGQWLAGNLASGDSPYDIAFDNIRGYIYISNDYYHSIIRYKNDWTGRTVLAGSGWGSGYAEGTGSAARFYKPSGMVLDAAGNIIVADRGNKRIRKITPGGVVSTLAGFGVTGTEDGPAATARFTDPVSVTIDANGVIFVSDGNRIRKISTDGYVSTIAGQVESGYVEGFGMSAKFSSPVAVAAASPGTLFITDKGNFKIRTISFTSNVDSYIWSDGSTGRTIQTNVAGTYSYKLVAEGCTSASSSPAQVNPVPAPGRPVITVSFGMLDAGPGGVGYEWSRDGIILYGRRTQTIPPLGDGAYRVFYVTAEGCYSDHSDPFIITGNETLINTASLSLMPNPAESTLRINGLKRQSPAEIYSLTGQKVLSIQARPDTDIDLQSLSPGIYQVKVAGRTLRLVKN
ncbi:MAG: SMP-30/gluconolactonase/LRE family protein [Bacteroidota bacterium]